MDVITRGDRAAILISSLGEKFAENVLRQVAGASATDLKQAIQRFQNEPPDEDVVTEVLEEFSRFAEFALANSSGLSLNDNSNSTVDDAEEFVSSGDPLADLETLKDYQIAGALREEKAMTIAIVLGLLSDERVGEVLRQLPLEVQEESFLRTQSAPKVPRPLLLKIVSRVVETASALDPSAASDPTEVAVEKTASLLRAMDRTTRTTLLKALEEDSPEIAEQVKNMLFLFEDILRFTNKTIQKLLTEVDTAELATALKNADAEIVERITDNLSKRAKANLMEEMEFMDSVSKDREEEAIVAICAVFAKLDQAGELEMLE